MKFLIALFGLVATASAAPQLYAAAVAPGVSSQYHSQDVLGQYSYGYAGGPSSKTETKTADGITRGSYSYIDSYGLVQTANYISDPVNGFRVARTDLPSGTAQLQASGALATPVQYAAAAPVHYSAAPVAYASGLPIPVGDTPEVAAAKAEHFRAHAEVRARNGIF